MTAAPLAVACAFECEFRWSISLVAEVSGSRTPLVYLNDRAA
jgi:hypothetical protein